MNIFQQYLPLIEALDSLLPWLICTGAKLTDNICPSKFSGIATYSMINVIHQKPDSQLLVRSEGKCG